MLVLGCGTRLGHEMLVLVAAMGWQYLHAYDKVHHEEKNEGGEGKPSFTGLEVCLKKTAYEILIMW